MSMFAEESKNAYKINIVNFNNDAYYQSNNIILEHSIQNGLSIGSVKKHLKDWSCAHLTNDACYQAAINSSSENDLWHFFWYD